MTEERMIVGVDEVGTGCLAGPVFAAVCSLPTGFKDPGIRDSKQLSESARNRLYEVLTKTAKWSVGEASVEEVDDLNVQRASFLAMRRALDAFETTWGKPFLIKVDGRNKIPKVKLMQEAIVGGDAKVLEIGAASIIAKVTRDRIMVELSANYPDYLLWKHKGYGTPEHIAAIKQYGTTKIHRKCAIKGEAK